MNSKHAEMLVRFLRKGETIDEGMPRLLMTPEQASNVADVVDSLRRDVERLTEKTRSQKLELRRLNTAHVMKNARGANLAKENVELAKQLAETKSDNQALIETVRAFLMGELEVVRPFKQVPMPVQGAPDLMSMVKDLAPQLPGSKPE